MEVNIFNFMKILVVHGPNLNQTGFREKNQYGEKTLEQINDDIIKFSKENHIFTEIFQSNNEGQIIDKLETSKNVIDGLIINPGAYSHYSYAIRDAIAALNFPAIEVHMSNIYNREDFRQKSVIAPVCVGQISGFKEYSYILAMQAFLFK